MEKCPFCGSELPSEARFCGGCGNSLVGFEQSDALTRMSDQSGGAQLHLAGSDPAATAIKDRGGRPSAGDSHPLQPSIERTVRADQSYPEQYTPADQEYAIGMGGSAAILGAQGQIPSTPQMPGLQGTPAANAMPSLQGTPGSQATPQFPGSFGHAPAPGGGYIQPGSFPAAPGSYSPGVSSPSMPGTPAGYAPGGGYAQPGQMPAHTPIPGQLPGHALPSTPPPSVPNFPGQALPSSPSAPNLPIQPTVPTQGMPPQAPIHLPSASPYTPNTAYGGSQPSYPGQYTPAHPEQPAQYAGQQATQPGQVPQQAAPHGWGSATGHVAGGTAKAGMGVATKVIIIVVIAVTVVAGSGYGAYAYYQSTLPKPVIRVTSPYTANGLYAGTTGTSLTITAHDFTKNSPITFLLDGHNAPSAPAATSNSLGDVSAVLPITSSWTIGNHTLTARDGSGFSTSTGVEVTVVTPGTSNTPGPNGAPPDDATFTINVSVSGQYNGGNGSMTYQETINVIGPHGNVCDSARDNGQPQHYTGYSFNGMAYAEDVTFSCSGTYKTGHVTYTEQLLTDNVTYTDAVNNTTFTCHLTSAHQLESLTGDYTTQGNFSGTTIINDFPTTDFTCDTAGSTSSIVGGTGNWTGTSNYVNNTGS